MLCVYFEIVHVMFGKLCIITRYISIHVINIRSHQNREKYARARATDNYSSFLAFVITNKGK